MLCVGYPVLRWSYRGISEDSHDLGGMIGDRLSVVRSRFGCLLSHCVMDISSANRDCSVCKLRGCETEMITVGMYLCYRQRRFFCKQRQ